MNLNSFLKELNKLNISFSLKGNDLKINAPKGLLSPELIEKIKIHKVDIIEYLKGIEQSEDTLKIPALKEQDNYEISHAQKRLWMIDKIDNGTSAYNISGAYRFKGNFNIDVFEMAVQELVKRHELLRSFFVVVEDEIRQKISKDFFTFTRIDISSLPDKEIKLEELAFEDAIKPFDLKRAPLFRTTVVSLSEDECACLFCMHHIISDGWSMNVFFNEVLTIYDAYLKGEKHSLLPLNIQYKDFAAWQNSKINSDKINGSKNFWNSQFNELPEALTLTTDFNRPPEMTFRGSRYGFSIPKSLKSKLENLSKKRQTTIFNSILAAFYLLLSKYSRQEDIIIGTASSGRNHPDLNSLIGIFINTLAIRIKSYQGQSFSNLLNEIRELMIRINEHQLYPFDKLISDLKLQKDLSRSALFDVMFTYNNLNDQTMSGTTGFSGIEVEHLEVKENQSQFDLSIDIFESKNGLECYWTYCTDLFKESTIVQMTRHFENILREITENPECKLSEINILSDNERMNLLVKPEVTKIADISVIDLVEKSVEKYQDKSAVVFEKKRLSYKELNDKANQLAHYIQKKYKPEADHIVALLLERSEWTIISILAVLKTGAAYLPIDPDHPDERINFMLKDSSAIVLITDKKNHNKIENVYRDKSILISSELEKEINYESVGNLKLERSSCDLIYLLYTSGTTGKPKGVMIENRSVVNLLTWFIDEFEINETTKSLELTAYSFDPSIEQIFATLISGGECHQLRKEMLYDIQSCREYIKEQKITILNYVPSFYQELLSKNEKLPSLKTVISGGERLPDELKDKLLSLEYNLYNNYGPTETTVDVLSWKAEKRAVSLGKPIANVKAYVLDETLNLLPKNVKGELYIGGDCLARGYLNRREENRNAFLENPFVNGERLYKTGDLVKWNDENELIYLGRSDEQVKVNGYRIELHEIQNTINDLEEIDNSVVTVNNTNDNSSLIAYLRPSGQSFKIKNEIFYFFSIAQRPGFINEIEALHKSKWPSFFKGSEVLKKYWIQIYYKFPEYQYFIVNNNDEIIAAINSVPINWNGDDNDIPSGWDNGIIRAFNEEIEKNTLFILAGIVSEKAEGKGLSYQLLNLCKWLAGAFKLNCLLAPVRPLLKDQYPDILLKDYCSLKDKSKNTFDPWLKVHEKIGGEIISYCEESQLIKGTIKDWEKWSGQKFEKSGLYNVKNTMQPISVDLEKNIATYNDQAVMVKHDVSGSLNKITIKEIMQTLKKRLPAYMVPEAFIILPDFPKLTTGKIDYQKLKKIKPEFIKSQEHENATKPNEILLLGIWKEILGKEEISINDNFFELGGDSIKAIQISSRMSNHGYKLEVKEVFAKQTIREIASSLKKSTVEIDQGAVKGSVPLTAIQKEFLESNSKDKHHYNHSMLFFSKEGFDEKGIKAVFQEIINHHDMLRAVFLKDNSGYQQEIKDTGQELSFEILNLKNETNLAAKIENESNRIQGSLDLEKGPLLKLALFKGKDGDRLLLVIHHLLVDGVSWRILFEDIAKGMKQYIASEIIRFDKKSHSFKYWSEKLRDYAGSEAIEKAKSYWTSLDISGCKELEKDNETGYRDRKGLKHDYFQLNEKETEILETKVNHAYGTEINEILLTALSRGVRAWQGHDQIAVSLEGHGREEILADIDTNRTVGWFTSVYPVILLASDDLEEDLIENKEHLRRIPNKGIDYGILRYIDEEKEGIFSFNPEIVFNYLGSFDKSIDDSVLMMAKESTGNSISERAEHEAVLDFSGIVRGGKLSLSVHYHEKEFTEKSIKGLLGKTEEALKEIIRHCSKKEERELTPVDLTYKGLSREELKGLSEEYEIEDIYPLSPMQEGMLFHNLFDGTVDNYLGQISYRLKGKINVEYFKKSYEYLINKYDILRTNFISKDLVKPVQLVSKRRLGKFLFEDIRSLSDKDSYLKKFKVETQSQRLNMAGDCLFQLYILQIRDDLYEFIWSSHHILMDGWCVPILIKDFYKSFISLNNSIALDDREKYSYKSYISWLEKQSFSASITYWRDYLEGLEEETVLPGRANNYLAGKQDFKSYKINLSTEETERLSKLCRKNYITLNTLMQVLWAYSLAKFNSLEYVVFGVVVSGRPSEIEGIEEMVGLFINTRPLRITFDENESLIDVCIRVQEETLKGENHLYYPLAEIQAESSLKDRLINHIFVYENYPVNENMNDVFDHDIDFEIESSEKISETNYDLKLVLSNTDHLKIAIDYNRLNFDEDILLKLIQVFERLIELILSNHNPFLDELDLLSKEEKHEQLIEFNQTEFKTSEDETVIRLFEEEVMKNSDSTALLFEDLELTYQELNDKANQLASYLLEKYQIDQDDRIAVIIERSEWLIISILAILKTGAGFVPVDSDYPVNRRRHIINDSNVKVVITDEEFSDNKIKNSILLSTLDLNQYSTENPNINTKADDLAYVIYTSGSTGSPKGVLVNHGNITNYILAMREKYDITEEDRILQFSSISFDAAIEQIFLALLSSARLVMIPKMTLLNPISFEAYIKKKQVSHFHAVPSFFKKNIVKSKYLKRIVSSGETFSKDLYEKLSFVPEVYNKYGTTECTVSSTINRVCSEDELHIGKPIRNTKVYILGKKNNLLKKGAVGEIAIAGKGISKGYLNEDKLNIEKFITNPFSRDTDYQKLYLTGDLGRYLENGNIEYIGRKDQQVKIRGNRVELGEIEAAIRSIMHVENTVVLGKKINNQIELIAYIACKSEPDINEIRSGLLDILPVFMIPSHFITLAEFPLTTNMKIDRKKLLEIEINTLETNKPYVEAGTDTEKKLVEIWEEVLGKERIGIMDNFFELGGHSLKAMQVITRVNKELKIEINPKFLFTNLTVKSIASEIDKLLLVSSMKKSDKKVDRERITI